MHRATSEDGRKRKYVPRSVAHDVEAAAVLGRMSEQRAEVLLLLAFRSVALGPVVPVGRQPLARLRGIALRIGSGDEVRSGDVREDVGFRATVRVPEERVGLPIEVGDLDVLGVDVLRDTNRSQSENSEPQTQTA